MMWLLFWKERPSQMPFPKRALELQAVCLWGFPKHGLAKRDNGMGVLSAETSLVCGLLVAAVHRMRKVGPRTVSDDPFANRVRDPKLDVVPVC